MDEDRVTDIAQDWFWTRSWQLGEAEASSDIANGRTEVFESDEAFLASLAE